MNPPAGNSVRGRRIYSDYGIHTGHDRDGEEVPHAVRIKLTSFFNHPLERFLQQLVKCTMADRPFIKRTPFVQYRSVEGSR